MYRFLLILFTLVLPLTSMAQDVSEEAPADAGFTEEQMEYLNLLANLKWQTGQIEVGNGLATLNLTEDFRFLGPDDAKTVLVDIWGNPPSNGYLGMLFPADLGPADPESWAVVVSFEEEGYVKDDDARDIDYSELLEEMQEGSKESNKAREEMGYPPLQIVGWAEPPHYDMLTKKLYWARELQFGDSAEHSLNYDIRVLGRKGVMVLTAVASMNQLETIKPGMESVVAFTEFNEGNRYADFNPDIDQVAAYGIAGLIAGKVALKAGFFKGLLALLIAGKKFVIIGAVAVVGMFRKLFGKGNDTEAEA